MPEEVAPHVEAMLADPDDDVRIFAVDASVRAAAPGGAAVAAASRDPWTPMSMFAPQR